MSAGGIGGVGGRREKTTALADECDSRCGACAATLIDEELEGGTGGTGSLSAHTGGPISSHSRASLCTRFTICLAQKSTPRRSRNPSRRRVLGSAAPYGTPRMGEMVDQLALPNRVAPRVDRGDWCGARGFRPPCRGLGERAEAAEAARYAADADWRAAIALADQTVALLTDAVARTERAEAGRDAERVRYVVVPSAGGD
jgi:hypothetical protein